MSNATTLRLFYECGYYDAMLGLYEPWHGLAYDLGHWVGTARLYVHTGRGRLV